MQAIWDCVDKIYCISLVDRKDRQAEARDQFNQVGLADRVEFVIVEKHPTNCEEGIYTSHLLCLKKGLEAGAERILIFEDDVVFDKVTPEKLSQAKVFLTTHEHWHILFLGCMVRRSSPTTFPSILNIGFRSLTHGYAIHRRFAEFLIRQTWQNVPYDDFLRDLCDEEMYILYPSIAFQSNSESDNERYLPLDRFRRLCGGLQKLQIRNEFYHRYRGVIITAHILLFFLIILVVFL